MIGIIVSMNADRVIGVDGVLPWRYPGDLTRFKRLTMGSTVIMGRKTWESIPAKFRPLVGRKNMVITGDPRSFVMANKPESVAAVVSLEKAIEFAGLLGSSTGDVWFIGGARVYAEAMRYADVIDVTRVPGLIPLGIPHPPVFFPPIDESIFCPMPIEPHPDEPTLTVQRWERRYGLRDNAKLGVAHALAEGVTIRAFADGSGTTADKPAFIGVAVFQGPMLVDEASAHVGNGSNITAELLAIRTAVIMVRRCVAKAEPFAIYSDSLWSISAITRQYRVSEHLPLVEEIRELLERQPGKQQLFHVKGHAGVPGNELADWLAGEARRKFTLIERHAAGKSTHGKKRPVMPDNEDLLAQARFRPRAMPSLPVCREKK